MTIQQLARESDGHYFDAAQGLYWYCVEYYAGMNDPLYRIQCELNYSPALSECSVDHCDSPFASDVYLKLIAGHINAVDVLVWIQAEHSA